MSLFDGKPEAPLPSSAVFSPDRVHRYVLTRWLEPSGGLDGPVVLFVMVNPSVAAEDKDDPTIRRCIWFAREKFGAGRLVVCNLFGYAATSPATLRKAFYDGVDVEGPENYRHLEEQLAQADHVVCAWGNHGTIGAAVQRNGFCPEWGDRSRPIGQHELAWKYIAKACGADRERRSGDPGGPWALDLTQGGQPAHPLMLPKSCTPFRIQPVRNLPQMYERAPT